MLLSVHTPARRRAGRPEKLRAAGVRVMAVGEAPAETHHNQPRDAAGFETPPKSADSAALFARLRRALKRGSAARAARGRRTRAPGVRRRDPLGAPGDGWVASVCNHLRETRTVTLTGADGTALSELDLGKPLGTTFTADPMVPLLLQMRAADNTQR